MEKGLCWSGDQEADVTVLSYMIIWTWEKFTEGITPPICVLWQRCQTQASPQWRLMKTHLELAKKHLKDSQNVRNKILWSDEPQFQSVVIAALCCGVVSQQQGLNTAKYRDNLNENLVLSIQNLS